MKAAYCSVSSSGVSLSGDIGFCLLPVQADSVEWIFDSLLSQNSFRSIVISEGNLIYRKCIQLLAVCASRKFE